MHPYLAQLLAKERREQFLVEAERDRALAGVRRERHRRLLRWLSAAVTFAETRARLAARRHGPERVRLDVCPDLECP